MVTSIIQLPTVIVIVKFSTIGLQSLRFGPQGAGAKVTPLVDLFSRLSWGYASFNLELRTLSSFELSSLWKLILISPLLELESWLQ